MRPLAPVLKSKPELEDLAQKRILICFSHLRWDFVYQRPQHLMSRAARDHRVFFFEEPVFENVPRAELLLEPRADSVIVARPVLPETDRAQSIDVQRRLLDELVSRLGRPSLSLWYYTPMALEFSRHLKADLIVYDKMDELSLFRGAPPHLIDREEELLARVDLVFTGGQSLYEATKHRHRNVYPFPSSIDREHFAKAQDAPADPLDQARLGRPRFGFFGVIDERLDIALVDAVAALRAQWQFVMLGPVVKIDPVHLPRRENLHWLGQKAYADLPNYMAHWDVGWMPFARNESTRFISPTKTPEFLAAGLPVIATPITDVVRPYGEGGLVTIAGTAEDIVAAGDRWLSGRDLAWSARVKSKLATMSWDRTWAAMQLLMGTGVQQPEQARRTVDAKMGSSAHA